MVGPLFRIDGLTIDAVSAGARRRLVDGIDLTVERGEICGVVGESGSGKSLSMMASVGLASRGLAVLGGAVTFADRTVPASAQDVLRRNLAHGVALLLQSAKAALNPFLRIERQIARVLALQKVPAPELRGRTERLLEAVNLDPSEIAPRYAHELSGGQAQRVAIACALATGPKVLIADEPTTALDVTTEQGILRLLTRLGRDHGLAVILVSHNLALVSQHCQRVSVFHAGHVVESGAVMDVFHDPLHPYTRGLLATVPDVDATRELVPLAGTVWGGGFATDRCRFSHRCSHVHDACVAGQPAWRRMRDHAVRCCLYEGATA